MRGSTGSTVLGPSPVGTPNHQCRPSQLAGRPRAHGTPAGMTVACPCGRTWRVTKRHHDFHGRRGAICGCGWELIDTEPEEAAA